MNTGASRQRIGVASPAMFWHDDPSRASINYECYIRTLRSLGLDTVLVCPTGSRCSPDIKCVFAPLEEYANVEFWKKLDINVVIMFTWLGFTAELRAMKAAGIQVISRADATGAVSVRLFPGETFGSYVLAQSSWLERFRTLKHWVNCYFRLHRAAAIAIIDSAKSSDLIAVETYTAAERLKRAFEYYGNPEQAEKLRVYPHLISEDILRMDVTSIQKKPTVVAVGRWNSWQKDAPLLRKALKICLENDPDLAVILIGIGGSEAFASLTAHYVSVQCTGAISRDEIASYMTGAQVLAISSHFESFHIAAHEALCLGCTVVGPDVIPMRDICMQGDYGRIAIPRTAEALAKSIQEELYQWKIGGRDTLHISQHWRTYLDSASVLKRMLAAL